MEDHAHLADYRSKDLRRKEEMEVKVDINAEIVGNQP